jgi:UDP-N-acetylmuramate--L-alanine ligase
VRVPVPDDLLPADRLGRVHFVGIGGAGLSGIARIMLARGIPVSGSDAKESPTLEALRALGARCHVGHAAEQVHDVDTVVVSTAVREDNPEVVEAQRQGLRLLPRSAALESVMQGRQVVAVAGTHGKTTTTSLLTVALQHCGADPSFAIGGELNESGSNAHDGSGEVFVAEADESDGAFLVYSPFAALVTNVEADHLDNYGTEEAYHEAFSQFLDRIDPDGFLIACIDDPGAAALAEEARGRGLTTVGVGESEHADLRAEDATFVGSTSTFGVVDSGRRLGEVSLQIPGRHYVLDALAALAARIPVRRPQARARGVHRDAPADGAQGRGRRSPCLRLLRPPPQRDQGRPAGRPGARRRRPRRGGVPAAPGLADPDLRGGHGPGARRRGRGRRHGRLRRARGPRARRQRADGRLARPAAARARPLRAVVVGYPGGPRGARPPG